MIDKNQTLPVEDTNEEFSKTGVNANVGQFAGLTADEKIDIVAKRVMDKYRKAFEELAK